MVGGLSDPVLVGLLLSAPTTTYPAERGKGEIERLATGEVGNPAFTAVIYEVMGVLAHGLEIRRPATKLFVRLCFPGRQSAINQRRAELAEMNDATRRLVLSRGTNTGGITVVRKGGYNCK